MKSAQSYNDKPIDSSELILNPDGSVYHLNIKEKHVGDHILIVGDQNRVEQISKLFDSVEHKIASREFCTHTGMLSGKRISVVSTGIGVDNIDIVINEIDAAVNIDLATRIPKKETRSLNFIRIGTSGSMQEDIPIGSIVASKFAFGFDGVPWFYTPENNAAELELKNEFEKQLDWNTEAAKPYFVEADGNLYASIASEMIAGITATANGFYGPQGRMLRLKLSNPNQSEMLRKFQYNNLRITNYEMESSGLYALGSMLGHKTLTTCVILANRYRGEFSNDPSSLVSVLIDKVLERLTS